MKWLTSLATGFVAKVVGLVCRIVRVAVTGAVLSLALVVLDGLLLRDVHRPEDQIHRR